MGMLYVIYGYGYIVYDQNIKTKNKDENDLTIHYEKPKWYKHKFNIIWGKKKPNQKTQTRIPCQVPTTWAKAKRKLPVQLIVG